MSNISLKVRSFTLALLPMLCLGLPALAQVEVPANLAVGGPVDYPGGNLKGEYWKRPPVSILVDGTANRANGIDNQIKTFGTADGTFSATFSAPYLGNDLSLVKDWLGADAGSFVGTTNNLDDGAFRFTGFINIKAAGTLNIGTTSDDGARITIGGLDIVNGDGSHGDETHDADVNFAAAGLYPIEITFFNGDWTSDGNNHTGNPDPGVHGGANFHLRIGGADITPAGVSLLYPPSAAPLPQVAVGLNFGADDNAVALGLAATDVAGAVPQANWNNLNGAAGTASGLLADTSGGPTNTSISVEWTSPNTWSSTGRGEENNGFPDGPDRILMTGYIDTGDADGTKATVTVSGIPADFTSGGYDVLVYALGGVAGRGGAYTIGGETKFGTAPASPTAHAEDPGVDLNDTGTYVRFRDLHTASFELNASADATIFGADKVNFRAPVNAIQIVKSRSPQAGLARGYLTKYRYDDIGNSLEVEALLTNPKYLNNQPDVTCLRSDFSANDNNECDNCGFSVRGFFIPRASGPHVFYLAADDKAALFLSTDENPANKVQIASEPTWSARRRYIDNADPNGGGGRGDPPVNRSAPINLVAGNLYYIEGAVKEAGGGDNLDVAVQGPGDPAVMDGDRPIYGDRIAAFADLTDSSLAITQNPEDARIPEGDTASFSVAADVNSPLCGGVTTYQWQRNGVDIPGATADTYSFGPVTADDHLSTYRVTVRIPGITRTSSSATLEVLGRQCLRVASAVPGGDLTSLVVGFNSFIDPTNEVNVDIFNYTINGGTPAVTAVTRGADGKSVILTTDPQAENTDYTLVVENVISVVGTTVCEAPTNMITFHTGVTDPCGGVMFEAYNTGAGNAVANLTSHPDFPDKPTLRSFLANFDSRLAYPDDSHEGYGARMRGLFIAPATANWVFYLASDDASQLFLNPTGPSAAGKIKIQEETGCCNAYTAHKSAAYPLTAGQGYYIEALYKEGTGGDFCRVYAGIATAPAPTGGTGNDSPSIPGAWMGYPTAPAGIGGPLEITQQPASQSVDENASVTFTVVASNPNDLPILYQWQRDGADIDGANLASYTVPLATLSDNGAKFRVKACVIGTSVMSDEATLAVAPDSTPPQCVSATVSGDFTEITVAFNELMNQGEIGDIFNFDVPGATITGVTVGADGKSTVVEVQPALTPNTEYTVTAMNVSDLAGNTLDSCLLTFNTGEVPPPSAILWMVGMDDNGWPAGDGGGPNATFVQEAGTNPLPGNPANPEVDQQADDDYYFAGSYTTVIAGNGAYTPVGPVAANEEAAERAFAGTDNDLRYHFNLPATLKPEDLLSVTFDALNLDDPATPANTDLRYGVEIYFNGVLVQTQLVIRPAQLDVDYTTPRFTAASVGAQVGPGFDNVVYLKGINYNAEGGGNWMGIDYVQLNYAPGTDSGLTIPASAASGPARDFPGGSLQGEYWQRPVFSILTDGCNTPAQRVDTQIAGFGPANGFFQATFSAPYLGNDLTEVGAWLGSDAASFTGTAGNLDDGAFRFTGYINITAPGPLSIGTTSDDGSRIKIGGIDVINNDCGHGDATVDTNVNFAAAGLYPIEITYFNGDWTSDGTDPVNHSGNPDPAVHGGANFHLRIGGQDVTATEVAMLHPPGLLVPPSAASGPPRDFPGGSLQGEYWQRPVFSILTDGCNTPAQRVDTQIAGFGPASGTFQATFSAPYLGNDLTEVVPWLGTDGGSFTGTAGNLDDGAFRFTGFINITAPGTLSVGTTSDDGSRIKIGGIDIVNNDCGHGDATVDTTVNFAAAGLYPIEITYFNGDWTSDGTDPVNHSGNPDPGVHGGANFHLRIGGHDVTPAETALLHPPMTTPPTLITTVVETGGDNEPTDTITAKWTGQTFPVSVANEPIPGAVIGDSYTVGTFGNGAPAYVDRNHRYTNADPVAIPAYLVGGEYIMSGNDNRDNAGYILDVTVSAPATAYLLIDNRLGDPNGPNTDPPAFGPTRMQWVLDQGWVPSSTGANRVGDPNLPDEVGIDESADGSINQYFSVYKKSFPAGTFQLFQADNSGQNMYGVVVTPRELGGVVYDFNDCQTPAGVTLSGTAVVADDGTGANCVLHLTDTNMCGIGDASATFPDQDGGALVDHMTARWRSRIGGDDGSVCTSLQFGLPGADGYSFSWGSDVVSPPPLGEEGTGTGLIVAVDTFDNADIAVPDMGIEIKWQGQRVAVDAISTNPTNAKTFLRKDEFVDAEVSVTSSGLATFTYDGVTISAQLANWTGIAGGRFVFAARTGGAADNHWIDDLRISTLGSGPVMITRQPQSVTVQQEFAATFSVGVDGTSPFTYQWYANGVEIPGATSAMYTTPPASPSDDGTEFTVVVGNSLGSVTSAVAVLTVLGDNEPPQCVDARALNLSHILLRFGELLKAETAQDLFNYDLPGGPPIIEAVLQANGSNVVLTVDGTLEAGHAYSVHITGVTDLAGNAVDCQIPFLIQSGGGYVATVLRQQPIAYWRFNDSVPTAINSGSLGAVADGTYNGAAAPGDEAPRPPAFPGLESGNTALQCNGSDAFVGALSGLMNSRPVFTISGWLRRNGDQPNRTGLWGQNDLVEFGYINNDTLEVWTDNGLHQSPDPTVNPFPNGEWAHVAFVSDGSPGTISMYTNGVFANSRSHTLPADNAFPFNIGGGGVFDDGAVNGNFFNGQIDEVAIFGEALNADQINEQYNSALVKPPGYDFSNCETPEGTTITGVAHVADDGTGLNCVMHLTDAGQASANGGWNIPDQLNGANVRELNVKWRSFIGGGTGGGADGYSFNWGTDVADVGVGEEGSGTGLSVTVDTFDNGGGETGLEIKWGPPAHQDPIPNANGRLAFLAIPKDDPGTGVFLRKNTFVDAELDVSGSGLVTFTYDGQVVSAQLPDYRGISGGRFAFGARTGGANDNQWLDDVAISASPVAGEQLLWAVGKDDNGWPAGDGGGPNASFVQENGVINPLPGVPNSPEVDQQADNDYYFAGSYTTAISSVTSAYGPYTPVGEVAVNEEAAERAFAGADNDLRYHFNLPTTLGPSDLIAVTFDALNLHTDGQADPRYGIEVYINGVLVQPQIVIRPADLDVDYTTPAFSLASVNAQTGPGFDNIVSLKGINYNAEGGGNWMGIDYVQLKTAAAGSVMITQQPTDQSFFISPTGPSGLLSEDFNSGDGGFTVANPDGDFSTPWTYVAGTGSWQVNQDGADVGHPMTSSLTGTPLTVTQAGVVQVTFNHRYSFEQGFWDGGALQVSINGGAFTTVPASAYLVGGPNGNVLPNSASALHGQTVFVQDSPNHQGPGYVTSTASLGYLNAGDTVVLRFLYAGDTNTGGNFQPNWELNDVAVTQGSSQANVTFRVVAVATDAISYQWERDDGAGFSPVVGANTANLTLIPTLADNGAHYRVVVSTFGASVTSDAATLTVIQPNTPPQFVCGPNQTAVDTAGAQTVAGWATDIQVHSITRTAITIASDFSVMPPGTRILDPSGPGTAPNPRVEDGVLKLTDANDPGGFGGFAIGPFEQQTFESLSASWRSRIGGGGGGGADGYSLNAANNLVDDFQGEEGNGTGLSVAVDTFDNADIEVPDVGIEINWKGARVASMQIPKDDDGSGNYLRKDTFVDASVTVDASGLATFTYDGNTIMAQLPDYQGIAVNQINLGARTGGANDNHWIDDLSLTGLPVDASSGEAGQTVQFTVSNDNPSLFSAQPAIAPDGTLTYTPAPGQCGTAHLTVVAMDNGGTANGGSDTSAPCSFDIVVTGCVVNREPVAMNSSVTVNQDSMVNFQLLANDPDGDPITYSVVGAPAHGVVVVQVQTGAASYSPTAGYSGPDSFTFKVNDGQVDSANVATVSITVVPVTPNRNPLAKLTAAPLYDFTPSVANLVAFSCNGSNACLALDASLSSDPDGDALTFSWFLEPSPVPFAMGAQVTQCLELGQHTIMLVADDGRGGKGTDSIVVEVLTVGEGLETLIDKVNNSTIARKNKRPFIASLKAAASSLDRGSFESAKGQLGAFQNKVRAQVSRDNPTDAECWIRWAQHIIDSTKRCQ